MQHPAAALSVAMELAWTIFRWSTPRRWESQSQMCRTSAWRRSPTTSWPCCSPVPGVWSLFARATRNGIWNLQAGRPIPRLRGQTLGLIGYGNIARALVPKALGFGLNIIAYTPRLAADALEPWGKATNDLEQLLGESDYVSIHVPLTPETKGLVNAEALRKMKPTAYLINTSRGAIIDEDALYRALQEGWIAGAGLDVLVDEPAMPANPLLSLDNVIVTPHAAFYSESAIHDLERKAAERVAQALRGEVPMNLVNPAVMHQPNCRLQQR